MKRKTRSWILIWLATLGVLVWAQIVGTAPEKTAPQKASWEAANDRNSASVISDRDGVPVPRIARGTRDAKGQWGITLSLQHMVPSAKTPARAYLYPAPAGVEGVLAWTIPGGAWSNIKGVWSQAEVPDQGLYAARVGAKIGSASTRFDFRVGEKPERMQQWNQGYACGLAIAPDGNHVVFGSEPEIHQEDSPEFFIELSALSELDLTTGKSRVLASEKDNRSGFQWSSDGRYLRYDGTSWRFPWEQEGLGLSFEMSYGSCVLDLQTLQPVDVTKSKLSENMWKRGNNSFHLETDFDEYAQPGERRSLHLTVLRDKRKTVLLLQGRLVDKARAYQVRQIIVPLELSRDGRYLFVRYGESDALKNPYGPLKITDQGVFAIDLDKRRAHLLAAFKSVADVAWRAT